MTGTSGQGTSTGPHPDPEDSTPPHGDVLGELVGGEQQARAADPDAAGGSVDPARSEETGHA
ncbi:hypothetical protein [Motilibacter aurantiacus]|uniref:hypothetical protein n=1 Tax=Motilibacter aurantiacus TaxID=2714955 RepID=UPI00140BBB91|nr:hypothetical protein [Motilibacter aurantiacus]NHC46221.1 hypothetical protein [Motilibacter aurantiacus]